MSLGLVDTSSSPSGSSPLNTFESSKHETRKESGNVKAQGSTQLPNFEGESQKSQSTPKLTNAGSKKLRTTKRATVPRKAVARSRKTEPEFSSKVPKGKKLKGKDPKAVQWNSVEDDWKSLKWAGDEDILRKATERTATTVDDYQWEPEDDWDGVLEKAEKDKRLFDPDLIDLDTSQSEPANKIESSKSTTTRDHIEHKATTTSFSVSIHQTKTRKTTKTTKTSIESTPHLRGFEDETNVPEKKSLVKVTHTPPEPQLRGFEDSVSVLEGETASVIDSEELPDDDYSLTYVDLDSDYDSDDAETGQEYDHSTGDESDYMYEEDASQDYSEYDVSVSDESDSVKSPELKDKPITSSKKRRMKLKKNKKWIKGEKKERRKDKQQHKKQSLVGMRKDKDESRPERRHKNKGDRSRATRLGYRRRLSRRHFGRNAGKEVFYSKGRRFFRGPRKRFPLRGKAKSNVRIYKQPRTKKAQRG